MRGEPNRFAQLEGAGQPTLHPANVIGRHACTARMRQGQLVLGKQTGVTRLGPGPLWSGANLRVVTDNPSKSRFAQLHPGKGTGS